jgi:hypothetical protein
MSARSTTHVGTSVEHFEQLNRERDALIQTSKQADRDREHALARLQELRASQKMLSNQVHVANDTLGVVHRELTMWKNEKARLQQVMQHERAEIQQCVDEGNELRAGETQRKRDFCRSMETLNNDLADLLMQQEDIRLQKMIAVESVAALLSYFLIKATGAVSEDRNDGGAQAGAQAMAVLHAAVSDLTNATGNFQDEMSRKKRLEEMVQQLRSRALQQMSSKDGAPHQVSTRTTIRMKRTSRNVSFTLSPTVCLSVVYSFIYSGADDDTHRDKSHRVGTRLGTELGRGSQRKADQQDTWHWNS